jgi:hypothetical protein
MARIAGVDLPKEKGIGLYPVIVKYDEIESVENYVSKDIRTIGRLEKIEVKKRTKAGGILELVLYGSENTVKITSELSLQCRL